MATRLANRSRGLWKRNGAARQIKHVTAALNAGKTITEICWGRIPGKPTVKHLVGFRNLRAHRELNPKFDDFVLSATAHGNSKAQQRRHDPERARIATRRDEANDLYKILGMVPTRLPSHVRDDIAQTIILALLEVRFSGIRSGAGCNSSSETNIACFQRIREVRRRPAAVPA